MTARRWLASIACVVSLAGTAAFPEAARADEAAEAAKAFDQGRKLWEAKDPAGALPHFQKAVAQSGSPNARLYVARCLRDTGKLAEAYDEMARTVRDATKLAEGDQRYAQTRDTAAAELALLEPKVGKLVITLDSTLAGATITVDGKPVDPALLGKPFTVPPQTLRIVATGADGTTTEATPTVAAGSTQSITLARTASGKPAEGKPAPIAPPPPAADEGGGFGVVRGVGIGVLAVGIGGFVAFAVGTVQADEQYATLEDECGAGPCRGAKYDDIISDGKASETIAYVGLGVGVAGVVAGTLMMIFGGPEEPAKAAWLPTADGVMVRF